MTKLIVAFRSIDNGSKNRSNSVQIERRLAEMRRKGSLGLSCKLKRSWGKYYIYHAAQCTKEATENERNWEYGNCEGQGENREGQVHVTGEGRE
jgi:hypothetical protein